MRILVTGGAGFIGSHLVDALLSLGHEVFALDNLFIKDNEANLSKAKSNKNFHFIKGDILDKELVDALIEKSDTVYHLAAIVGVKYVVDNTLLTILVNVEGTLNILASAHKYKRRVVLASSSEVYGRNRRIPLSERTSRLLGPTWIPRWCYSTAKALDEHLAFAYYHSGLPVTCVRYFNIYGPRINSLGYGTVIANFIRQALTGEPITVHGTGNQTRSFTYVSDAVEGTILAGTKNEAIGEVFNIGSPKNEIRIVDLANLIKKLTNSPSPIIHIPYEDYFGSKHEDVPRRVPNINKARKLLGFEPKVSLEEGLVMTIEWCKKNWEIHSSQSKGC
ncbi:GDP-mannose 4,6-dehydratase [bacterium]|nr:GDP-mannose 4,6-dehydratase [bacterium]